MKFSKVNILEIMIGVALALTIFRLGEFAVSKIAEKNGYDSKKKKGKNYNNPNETVD